jgi:hypothetical protein
MTDLKKRRAKIKAPSPDRQARPAPLVDGHASGGGPAGQADDLRAGLEGFPRRPITVISAVDLCNGDYEKRIGRAASEPTGRRDERSDAADIRGSDLVGRGETDRLARPARKATSVSRACHDRRSRRNPRRLRRS